MHKPVIETGWRLALILICDELRHFYILLSEELGEVTEFDVRANR